jgi:hypothetical protein
MGNSALVGAGIGTTIMPGVGTVGGAMVGGLVGLFSGPEAQQQSANVGGQTIDARKIWETINGGSSASVRDGADAAGTLQSVHDQRSQQIASINQAMDAAWQGDASQQVQAGAHPLGIWLQDSASNLTKSHAYLNNQGDAFDTAQSKVQEIAATPPHAGFMDHVNPFSDKDDEIKKYNEQGQTNVQAFNAYYQASAQNAAGMPQFSAWQGNTFSNGKGNGHDGNGPGSGHTGTNPGTGGGGGYQPGGAGGIPGGGTGGIPGYGTKIPGAGSGGAGGYQPNVPGYNNPSSTIPGSKSPSWNDGTAAASYTPSTSGTDFGAGGFGPTGSGSSGYGGGSGSGAGGFGVGGGSVGGFGPAGSGSLGSGASTGAGAGTGSGAAGGVRGGAAAGGAGAAGRGGASGMSGMGQGGRGKGSEDEEHQTKYLVSEDPNELFGTDELTTPPVIGE